MTDREIEIIDAVGEYVDRKFGDNAHEGESYTEEAQDYFNELLDRVEDACNERFVLSPMLLNKLIKEMAQEMYQDEMATLTLKNALGL